MFKYGRLFFYTPSNTWVGTQKCHYQHMCTFPLPLLHGHFINHGICTSIGGSMSVQSPTANLPSVFFLMPQSHQTFSLVSVVKLMGNPHINRCWTTTFHTIIAADADGWCHKLSVWSTPHSQMLEWNKHLKGHKRMYAWTIDVCLSYLLP